MRIADIKRLTADTNPHYFSRATLRFFGQTMRSFSVVRQSDGRYQVSASMYSNGRYMGHSVRYFNPTTNELERA